MDPEDLEPEDLEPESQPQGAARRVQNRELDQTKRELDVVDAVPGLSKDQRTAVLAVAKNGDYETAAKTLGFVTEEPPPGPSADELAKDTATLGNMAAAAAGSFAPSPAASGAAAIQSVYERAQRISNPAELIKLRPELDAAIASAGLHFGSAEAIGGFEPL